MNAGSPGAYRAKKRKSDSSSSSGGGSSSDDAIKLDIAKPKPVQPFENYVPAPIAKQEFSPKNISKPVGSTATNPQQFNVRMPPPKTTWAPPPEDEPLVVEAVMEDEIPMV